jgi:tetratricopeptide (TPR) repeat protein
VEQEADAYSFLGALACQQRDYKAAITWYEESFQANQKRSAMDTAARCCVTIGNLCLGRIRDNGRDFPSAKRWFRKAIEVDPAMAWRDRFTLFARLWRYRLFGAFMS